jgi:hypothetical protein
VTSYVSLTLRAMARKGWPFKGWTGTDRGSRPTRTVPMRSATTVGAVFVRR